MAKAQSSWGGRFKAGAAQRLRDYTESVSFDRELARHDITGSRAHAKMLARIGVLKPAELRDILKGLDEIFALIDTGKFAWRTDLEDVHMNIESELTRRYPAGAKLHTGRSRNDQVATAVRLWIKDQIAENRRAITALQLALHAWAVRDLDVIIPGYTHLQRAQPVYLSHHLLAYFWMLLRDRGRFDAVLAATSKLPLGAGALAGVNFDTDRGVVAERLGFSGVSENSIDAVSNRDFVLDYLAAAATCATHLSRLGAEIVLWSSEEFGFCEVSDA